jgi:hypothetical protein
VVHRKEIVGMRPKDPQGPAPGSWDEAREAFLLFIEDGINPVEFFEWSEASQHYGAWLFQHLLRSHEDARSALREARPQALLDLLRPEPVLDVPLRAAFPLNAKDVARDSVGTRSCIRS